jgi:hypothetical protein
MEALELEPALTAGQFEEGRDRQRIVSGELRKIRGRRPLIVAGDVVQIGHLAGKRG